jgi:hypothetical protein
MAITDNIYSVVAGSMLPLEFHRTTLLTICRDSRSTHSDCHISRHLGFLHQLADIRHKEVKIQSISVDTPVSIAVHLSGNNSTVNAARCRSNNSLAFIQLFEVAHTDPQ